jgi:hypothetical protein
MTTNFYPTRRRGDAEEDWANSNHPVRPTSFSAPRRLRVQSRCVVARAVC